MVGGKTDFNSSSVRHILTAVHWKKSAKPSILKASNQLPIYKTKEVRQRSFWIVH